MLYEKVKTAVDNGLLAPWGAVCFVPTALDRKSWTDTDAETKAYYEGRRSYLQSAPIPLLPASLYMEFARNGNRTHFEDAYFTRRRLLFGCLVSECLTCDGKLLDRITDLIWAICEESSWVIPAHTHQATDADGKDALLPDASKPHGYIDLFSAETGSLLAWCLTLLRDRLSDRPVLLRRMEFELQHRIVEVFLTHPEMHWTGLVQERQLNNWTPWIYSNLLAVMLLTVKEDRTRTEIALRAAKGLDKFLSAYPADGGCDEGPGYFSAAGASLLDCLELLDIASRGAIRIYDEPLIRNMSRYIMYVHIAKDYYINFADAACRTKPDCTLLSRAAKSMGDEVLLAYAENEIHDGNAYPAYYCEYNTIFRRLRNIMTYRRSACVPEKPHLPLSHYFEGIQVVTAREKPDAEGLFLACKGGHNKESHNHNDIGSYIIYADGKPCIIDIGPEPYRRETFNEARYTIWVNQSRYHATAIVGGCDQQPGREFAAKDTRFADSGDVAEFFCDISGAYGAEAKMDRYGRTITLDRKKHEITVADSAAFRAEQSVVLPLMCAEEPVFDSGSVQIGKLRLGYDESKLTAEKERIELCESLQNAWERPCVWRLLLKSKDAQTEFNAKLTFSL